MSKQDFETNTVKSTGDVENPDSTKLTELAEENDGSYIYDDSAGATTEDTIGKNNFSEIDRMAEKRNIQELFGKIEEKSKEKDRFDEAIKEANKSLGVDDYTAEIFLSDELTLVSEEYTPAHDVMPRVAVPQSDTVKIDEIADIAQAESSDQTSGNPLPSVDHGFNVGVEYNIKVVGLETGIEDRVRLTGQRYSMEETQAMLNTRAIERYHERQTLRGTANDVNGYLGISDHVDNKGEALDAQSADFDTVDMNGDKLSALIGSLEDDKVAKSNMMIVLSLEDHRALKETFSDLSRIVLGQSNDDNNVDLSFDSFTYEQVTIAKSHALNGTNEAYGFDASKHFYGFLRDTTVKALPPNQLDDRMVTYQEMTLVSRARGRTVRLDNIGVQPA